MSLVCEHPNHEGDRLMRQRSDLLEERTEWARRLQGETSALSHQLALIRESRWMKLGRKVGFGPVLPLK